MEKLVNKKLSIRARKWGALSILEQVIKKKKNHSLDFKNPKRDKTEFFPERLKVRKTYKEKPYFLISPENSFKVLWNSIKIVLIITEAILIPYALTFCPDNP